MLLKIDVKIILLLIFCGFLLFKIRDNNDENYKVIFMYKN